MSYSCIKPWDTNKTLEATFRFIYQNQGLPDGKYLATRLYLAPALRESQTYDNYDNRDEAFNFIFGRVIEVKETYLKIQTGSRCVNELQVYTVSYSEIIDVTSDVLTEKFNKYEAYMSRLPMVCDMPGNRYYDLLARLKKELLSNEEYQLLYLIYSGRFSLGYKKEDYTIISNLVLIYNPNINSYGILPITMIQGFFSVESKNEEGIKEEKFVKDNEIIGRCI